MVKNVAERGKERHRNPSRMIAHVELQARTHRKNVMNALRLHGQMSSQEITESISSDLKNELEQKWDTASARGEEDLLRKDEFMRTNFHPPVLRTVQLILRQLLAEKLVQETHDHQGRQKYSLTELANDVKYWAEEFGSEMLLTMAKHYHPSITTLDQNVENLINMFGTYIVFCFMELARRNPKLKSKFKRDELSELSNDELVKALYDIDKATTEAVKHLFDPGLMYMAFLATVRAQKTDEEIAHIKEHNFKPLDDGSGKALYVSDEGKEPPSLIDEVVDHFHDVEVKSESYYRKTFDTMYDLPGKQVYAVFEAMKKRNEDQFYVMFKAMSKVMGGKYL